MANTITFCMDNPIKTSIRDWMAHRDRFSVGRRVDDDNFEILAYSDNEDDVATLYELAKKEHALKIHSFISEGVTALD